MANYTHFTRKYNVKNVQLYWIVKKHKKIHFLNCDISMEWIFKWNAIHQRKTDKFITTQTEMNELKSILT